MTRRTSHAGRRVRPFVDFATTPQTLPPDRTPAESPQLLTSQGVRYGADACQLRKRSGTSPAQPGCAARIAGGSEPAGGCGSESAGRKRRGQPLEGGAAPLTGSERLGSKTFHGRSAPNSAKETSRWEPARAPARTLRLVIASGGATEGSWASGPGGRDRPFFVWPPRRPPPPPERRRPRRQLTSRAAGGPRKRRRCNSPADATASRSSDARRRTSGGPARISRFHRILRTPSRNMPCCLRPRLDFRSAQRRHHAGTAALHRLPRLARAFVRAPSPRAAMRTKLRLGRRRNRCVVVRGRGSRVAAPGPRCRIAARAAIAG